MSLFKRYSYWVNSGKFTAMQKFATLGMGIASFMMLTRFLGPKTFGVWGLFLLISSITETARTALIKNAFVRFAQQGSDQEFNSLQSAALVLSGLISLVMAAVFFFLADGISWTLNAPGLNDMLKWYALTIMISVLFSHVEIIMTAKFDFKGICWVYCVRQGTLLVAIFVCYIERWTLTPAMLSILYLASLVAGTLAGLLFSWKLMHWRFTGYKLWFSRMWHFGKYVLGNNISSLLFRSTDNFVTSRYFGTVITGHYNSCLRISNLVDMPSQVLGDVLYPKAAKLNASDQQEIRNMYTKTVGASLVFSIPALLVLILMPEFILRVLAGPAFVVAAPILRITAFFGFILPFLKQFGTIMDATGFPKVNFLVMFLAFCLNIGFNLLGIYLFGPIGAAIGTATTYFVIFLVSQAILYRKFSIQVADVFKSTWSFYKILFSHGRSFLVRTEVGR
jgi:lipopolysaccharide exporter